MFLVLISLNNKIKSLFYFIIIALLHICLSFIFIEHKIFIRIEQQQIYEQVDVF